MSATNFYSGKIFAAENGRGASCGAASNRSLQDVFRSTGAGFKQDRGGSFSGLGTAPRRRQSPKRGDRTGCRLRPQPDLRRLKAEDEAGAEVNQLRRGDGDEIG